jgi:hypothetical protein
VIFSAGQCIPLVTPVNILTNFALSTTSGRH